MTERTEVIVRIMEFCRSDAYGDLPIEEQYVLVRPNGNRRYKVMIADIKGVEGGLEKNTMLRGFAEGFRLKDVEVVKP